ncbi:interferon-induced protein with tetratricopeptide repeats 1-like [Scophthalmus maximus]|uniref:interferon-induced protein with tetratricopeptide repeats 1-like n=1 Tax=Scophthalmus maximus TaxID=52904 RepID=UPI001FA841B5|nr:interferon-induced protein with tetratricopeptide repeats 1-like [Scophthalmus maximus]
MSAAQSEITLKAQLEALQCHFTWDLDPNRSKLLTLMDKLQDIGTEEGNFWLGQVYNLQGYIHFLLGSADEAKSFFSRAAEAFRRMREPDEGPWLLVNYGNQAWLHHRQGEEAESRACLSKVEALMEEYPSPSEDELHPEVYAEKAWTLMNFGRKKQRLAADIFQRAMRMQPDVVEWQTSYVLGLTSLFKHSDTGLEGDDWEKMRQAKEQDPENLYLAAKYLQQLAKKGESVKDEARELATRVLRNPVGSYSGIKPLLMVYRFYVSTDEGVKLAAEALEKHPDDRYLKRCAALGYKWRITSWTDSRPEQSMIQRAILLHEEVISLYPHSSFVKRMDLASVYAKSNQGLAKSDQIYRELLARDLEPAETQVLFNNYAKYLNSEQQDRQRSIKYHMKAAEIPIDSFFRQSSIKTLEKIRDKRQDRMCREIDECLARLEEPQ